MPNVDNKHLMYCGQYNTSGYILKDNIIHNSLGMVHKTSFLN